MSTLVSRRSVPFPSPGLVPPYGDAAHPLFFLFFQGFISCKEPTPQPELSSYLADYTSETERVKRAF